MTTVERAARQRSERRATGRRLERKLQPTEAKLSYSGARFGRFCWRYCRQTKGEAGRRRDPLGLFVYQLDVFSDLLRVERDQWLTVTLGDLADPERFWEHRVPGWMDEVAGKVRGLRVHREGLLGIPKKNGKSTSGSALGLYLLMADGEEGAEVYSTASTRDQARIVFRQAQEMVDASPRLLEKLRKYRNLIEHPGSGSFYKAVAADAGGLEGINPHGVVNDEIHAQRDRALYDTLRSATIYREQPILFSITTAGVKIDGTIAGELYLRGAGAQGRKRETRIRDGKVVAKRSKQRSFYFRWYQVPWSKREELDAYEQANPAPTITRAKLREEMDVDRPRAIFYRYHGNMWTRVEVNWLKPGQWEACKTAKSVRIKPGDPVVLGIDIGLSYDSSAITIAKPSPYTGADPELDDNGRPTGRLVDDQGVPITAEDDRILVEMWSRSVWRDPRMPAPPTHEHETQREELRLGAILDKALELCETYNVIAIGADPYKFTDQLQELDDRGIMAIRFDQTNAKMVPASEGLLRVIGQRRLGHTGDEILATHIDAAAARDAGYGHWRLDKKHATEIMDGAISTAIAVDLAENPEVAGYSRPTITLL